MTKKRRKFEEIDEYDERELDEDEDDEQDDDESARPKARKQHGISRSKKIAVIVIILLIIGVAYAAFMLNPTVKDIIVDTPIELKDESGVEINCHVVLDGGGTANGEGKVEIFYEGRSEYSNNIKINSDNGRIEVPYNKFVIGNSQYEVRVTFNDKTVAKLFKLSTNFGWSVAEEIEVSAQLSTYEKDTDIRIRATTTIIPPPKAAEVEVTISHESGSSETFTEIISDSSYIFENYIYLDTGSGDYTIDAKITNQLAKKSSDYYEVEVGDPIVESFNIYLVADAGDDRNAARNEVIQFDGSGSWNDGEIVKYEWDFDVKDDDNDDVEDFTVDATGMVVEHSYSALGTYTVGLRITGDFLVTPEESQEQDYEVSFDTIDVTIRII